MNIKDYCNEMVDDLLKKYANKGLTYDYVISNLSGRLRKDDEYHNDSQLHDELLREAISKLERMMRSKKFTLTEE